MSARTHQERLWGQAGSVLALQQVKQTCCQSVDQFGASKTKCEPLKRLSLLSPGQLPHLKNIRERKSNSSLGDCEEHKGNALCVRLRCKAFPGASANSSKSMQRLSAGRSVPNERQEGALQHLNSNLAMASLAAQINPSHERMGNHGQP